MSLDIQFHDPRQNFFGKQAVIAVKQYVFCERHSDGIEFTAAAYKKIERTNLNILSPKQKETP